MCFGEFGLKHYSWINLFQLCKLKLDNCIWSMSKTPVAPCGAAPLKKSASQLNNQLIHPPPCRIHQRSDNLSVESADISVFYWNMFGFFSSVFSPSLSVVSFPPRCSFSHKDRTVGVCFQPENTVTHSNGIWEVKAELNNKAGRVYSPSYTLNWVCTGLHWSVQVTSPSLHLSLWHKDKLVNR